MQEVLSPDFISICFCYVNLALEEDALFTALEMWFTVSGLMLQSKVSNVDFPNALVLV